MDIMTEHSRSKDGTRRKAQETCEIAFESNVQLDSAGVKRTFILKRMEDFTTDSNPSGDASNRADDSFRGQGLITTENEHHSFLAPAGNTFSSYGI